MPTRGPHSGLDPDDQTFVAKRHLRRRLRFHVGQVLLELVAPHAVADDVEKRQHAGPGPIDDALLEIVEAPPARGSRVHDRGHARAQREAVGIQAVVAGIGSSLARAGVHMDVNVDEPRRHVVSRRIDHFQGVGRIDVRCDCRYLSVRNGHIANRADPVPGIDDVAALQQEVVLLLRRHMDRRRHDETGRRP